jgi:hypothetical protein
VHVKAARITPIQANKHLHGCHMHTDKPDHDNRKRQSMSAVLAADQGSLATFCSMHVAGCYVREVYQPHYLLLLLLLCLCVSTAC